MGEGPRGPGAGQETYRVVTSLGRQERPLPKGRYKDDPNNPVSRPQRSTETGLAAVRAAFSSLSPGQLDGLAQRLRQAAVTAVGQRLAALNLPADLDWLAAEGGDAPPSAPPRYRVSPSGVQVAGLQGSGAHADVLIAVGIHESAGEPAFQLLSDSVAALPVDMRDLFPS